MQDIHVLGLGPGIENYRENGNITIGVNDIWRYVSTRYVLCLDKIGSFSLNRYMVIKFCSPKVFWTIWPEWGYERNIREININPPGKSGELDNLDNIEGPIPFHVDSTFSAVCMAYRLMLSRFEKGRIILFGCRFYGHPQLEAFIKPIQDKYEDLGLALDDRGIQLMNADPQSALNEVLPFAENPCQ